MSFILGKKLGMSQVFREDKIIPVTLVQAGPCQITQLKTKGKDGYNAVQIGLEKENNHFRHYKEFRVNPEDCELGTEIKVDSFKIGDQVKVSGVSKGKGFQGVVKKWGFAGRDKGHGGKGQVRTTGAIGSAYPQRVWKGRKMPGRAGGQRTTIRNLEIIDIDQENNLLAIKGGIPGSKDSLLEIRQTS